MLPNFDLAELARQRRCLLGGFVFSPDPHIPAIYAQAGFDFVVLDMEHCLHGPAQIQAQLLACAAASLPAVVRVGPANLADAARLLDGGAAGIAYPHLGGPGVAESIASLRYAPDGERPTCTGTRAAGYGLADFAQAAQRANAAVVALGLVEDREAVDRLDAVLDTTRVDWLMPGPADLATSFGVPGQLRHPSVEQAVAKVRAAAQGRGLPFGAYVNSLQEVAPAMSTGASFVLHSIDYKILGQALGRVVDVFGTEAGV